MGLAARALRVRGVPECGVLLPRGKQHMQVEGNMIMKEYMCGSVEM